jgi:zinc protease
MNLSRKFRLLTAVFAFALTLSLVWAEAPQVNLSGALPRDPDVVSGTFANGLSYSVVKNTEPANRIFLRLVVKAGSALEADDQKGVAHFVEHMAFNGTEHFKKNDLIDYFESIGMAFGPEVNAYTSFDETVYMLEVPADNPDMLKNALLVFRDWASALSFDQTELDKERGVVVEEWRLGRGVNGRVGDKEIPFLFNASKYGLRLPIGDPEIIKTVSRERVVDFYKTWYRPDLMTVAVAGDFDAKAMIQTLSDSLGAIAPVKTPLARPTTPVTPQSTPGVLVIRDPEIQYTTLQILEQRANPGMKTAQDYRRDLTRSIAFAAFNARLNEKVVSANPLMLGAQAGSQSIVRPTYFTYFAMVPSPGQFGPAFSQMMEEFARLETFGVTEPELARAKQSLLDNIDEAWLNRDKINSANRVNGLVQEALNDDPLLSLQQQKDLYHAIIPAITAKDVAASISDWFTGNGRLLLVTAPASTTDLPADADLLTQWQSWKPSAALAPYAESGLERELADGVNPVAGKIVKEEKISKDGIKRWTLSNGAKVLLYPTNFKANEILVSGLSKGGSSLVTDADFPSAALAVNYADFSGLNGFSAVDLGKKLAGKTVSLNGYVSESLEGFDGSSSVEDLETLLQLINLGFTKPNFTDQGWQALYAQLKTVSESRAKSPEEKFSDLATKLVYGNSVRHSTLTPEFVSAIDRAKAERIYRERFANAGDFTFVFVGSLDEAKLKPLVEKWIASLPSAGKAEEARDVSVAFPKGVNADSLKMGIDPKSHVYIAFGGKADSSKGEDDVFEALRQLLDIRLREIIREDMSGTYGVSVGGQVTLYPAATYSLSVSFGCEPGREESLTKSVFEQIEWLKSAPVPESYITKLKETLRREREVGLKNNGWWRWQITHSLVTGTSLDEITATDAVLARITGASMQAAAKRYLDNGNYVKAFLMPENAPAKN